MIHAEITLPPNWQDMTLDDVLASLEPTDEELAAIEAAEAEAGRLWYQGIDEMYQQQEEEAEWWATGHAEEQRRWAMATEESPPW